MCWPTGSRVRFSSRSYTPPPSTPVWKAAASVFTPSYEVMDEPTTFWCDGQAYKPKNFEDEITNRMVSLRYALAHSLNIPTVKVAEKVGYRRRGGDGPPRRHERPHPADAGGGAGRLRSHAARSGGRVHHVRQPRAVSEAQLPGAGARPDRGKLDLPAARGEQAGARPARGLHHDQPDAGRAAQRYRRRRACAATDSTFPPPGKTGTSRDGWFAGYTSELLCVVWVGFDDNRDLDIEGAHSAAPIWMQFMKDALKYREYRDTKPFEAPDGIVSIEIDPQSGEPATPACPERVAEVYIAGTQPVGACHLHGGKLITTSSGWDTPAPAEAAPAAPAPPVSPAGHLPQITGTGGRPGDPGRRPPRRQPDSTRRRPSSPTRRPRKTPNPASSAAC